MFCAESTSHHCTAPNNLPAFNSVQIEQAQRLRLHWIWSIFSYREAWQQLNLRTVRWIQSESLHTFFLSSTFSEFISSVRNAIHKSVHTEMETRVMERTWDWIMRLYCRIAEAVYTPLWWLRGAMIGAGEGLPFSQRLRRRWPSLQAKSRHPASDHRSL